MPDKETPTFQILANAIFSRYGGPPEGWNQKQMEDLIFSSRLDAREQQLLMMRSQGLTYKAIGNHFDVTTGRVQQMHGRALRRLMRTARDLFTASRNVMAIAQLNEFALHDAPCS